jgi:hypothetical protein
MDPGMSPTFSKRPLPLYALDGGEPALDLRASLVALPA